MSATNDTFRASVASASATKQTSLATAEMVYQAARAAALAVAGVPEGSMSGATYTTYAASCQAAAVARVNSVQSATAVHQSAVETARNVARDAGEKLTQ
jgi:hypothetical protein